MGNSKQIYFLSKSIFELNKLRNAQITFLRTNVTCSNLGVGCICQILISSLSHTHECIKLHTINLCVTRVTHSGIHGSLCGRLLLQPTTFVLKQRIWRTAFVPAGGTSETVPFRGQSVSQSVLFSLRAGEQVYAQLMSGREICGDIWGRTSLADTYFYPTES